MSPTIPEGLTDPDEIDRYLEARDAGVLHTAARQAAQRDADDAAVMATLPRNRDAVIDTNSKKAITARIAYDQKPFWQRCRDTLKGERPAGLVDRYPIGPWSTAIPQDSTR